MDSHFCSLSIIMLKIKIRSLKSERKINYFKVSSLIQLRPSTMVLLIHSRGITLYKDRKEQLVTAEGGTL